MRAPALEGLDRTNNKLAAQFGKGVNRQSDPPGVSLPARVSAFGKLAREVSYAELAARMGSSEGAVQQATQRLRKR